MNITILNQILFITKNTILKKIFVKNVKRVIVDLKNFKYLIIIKCC